MSKILVVDDEPLIVEMVEESLSEEGYTIVKAYSGEQALEKLEHELPDLVILDLMLPGMDGYEVCRQMQRDARFNHIPVIMLTAKTGVGDRVAGYDQGADDYITKPFETDELLRRVRAQLQHLRKDDYSELTSLPGPKTSQYQIEERTSDPDEYWTIVYADIEHLSAYNEVYSFAEGDELIRQAATCLRRATQERGSQSDFVGHIGGDDFVILTTPDKSAGIAERAAALFNQIVPDHFNPKDRANHYFTFLNHAGESVQVPLVSLVFDIVDNQPQ